MFPPIFLVRWQRNFAPVLTLALCALFLASGCRAADKEVETEDVSTVRARYMRWVLGTPEDSQYPLSQKRLDEVVQKAEKALATFGTLDLTQTRGTLYDTSKPGADDAELRALITEILPSLSIAYQLQGNAQTKNPYYHDEKVKEVIFQTFDHLNARGFRQPMQMPWKAAQIKQRDPKQAFIVDFILRVAGYPLATLLMRDELRATGRFDTAIATCWDIESHPEKVGDMRAHFLEADAVRLVLNISLPTALAEGNTARLDLLREQLNRSMTLESNDQDTIKPDGLVHHHLAVYPEGYAANTVSEAAFAAWLLQGTRFACSEQTVANIAKGLETLRIISQKYETHQALGGRFPTSDAILSSITGYGYLADMPHPRRREFQGMVARLADEAYLADSRMTRLAFMGQRNEVPAGPGGIADFMRSLAAAKVVGAEAEPQGHWSLNYGPLEVHRRDNWMVSIKGYSRYWWSFEHQMTNARQSTNQQNMFGFHDGSASLQIYGQGQPFVNSKDSGYVKEGWDWSRIPGTTTRYLTTAEMLAMKKVSGERFHRTFSDATLVGGVTLEGRYGVFAMDYSEVAPDNRPNPLRALKSAFFFDDQIVLLTTGIRSGDGVHSVGTTLFQTGLKSDTQPTWVQNQPVTGLVADETVLNSGSVQLVDAAGNGYFIPAGQKVVVTRGLQTSLDESASQETKANFATAWIDHGISPDNARGEYVILVRSGAPKLADFAKRAAQEYRVLRSDDTAHIVTQNRLGLTGYVIAKANTNVDNALVAQTSAPCLMMTRRVSANEISASVCNPDLGWTKGVQYGTGLNRADDGPPMKSVPMPVTVILKGHWRLKTPVKGATLANAGASTKITLPTGDARSIAFTLLRQAP